jgi:hypothetical protein
MKTTEACGAIFGLGWVRDHADEPCQQCGEAIGDHMPDPPDQQAERDR